jgi:hypothetical protein
MDEIKRYELGSPMDEQVNVKMTPRLKARLNKMYAVKGLAPAEILRRLAYEAVIHFEQKGDFTFPVTITPEKFQNQEVPLSQGGPMPDNMPTGKTKPELGMPGNAAWKGRENMSEKITAHRLEAARVTGKTYHPHEQSKLTSAKGLALPKRLKRGQRRPESLTDKF